MDQLNIAFASRFGDSTGQNSINFGSQLRVSLAGFHIRQRRGMQDQIRFFFIQQFFDDAGFGQFGLQIAEIHPYMRCGIRHTDHGMGLAIHSQGKVQAKQPAGACHQDAHHSSVPCLYPSSIGRMISRICGMESHSVLVLLA